MVAALVATGALAADDPVLDELAAAWAFASPSHPAYPYRPYSAR